MDYEVIEEKKTIFDYAKIYDKGVELWPGILIKIPEKEAAERIKEGTVNGYTFKYFLAFGTFWLIYSHEVNDGESKHIIGSDTEEWLEFDNVLTNTDLVKERVEIKIGDLTKTYGLAIRYETLRKIFKIKARDTSTHPNAVIGFKFKTYEKFLPSYHKIFAELEKIKKRNSKH